MKHEIDPRGIAKLATAGGLITVAVVMSIVAPPARTVELPMSTSLSTAEALLSTGVTPGRSTPVAKPSDTHEERLVLYTNSEDGYELQLPASWADSARRVTTGDTGTASILPGVIRIARDVWSLTISIGTPDGEVVICDRAALCTSVVVTTLDELDGLVVSSPIDLNGTVSVDPVDLGGEPGRLESPRATCTADLCTVAGRGGHWMFSAVGFPGTRTVVALHDGRPVVMQFEWFSSTVDEVKAIIDSFRFLDDGVVLNPTDEPETGAASSTDPLVPFKSFTFAEAGFRIDAPVTWHSWSPDVGSFGEVSLTGPGMAIAIRLPVNDAGKIWFVLPPGMAHAIAVNSVQDLVTHLVDEYRMRTLLDRSRIRAAQTQTMLGGDPATLVVIGPNANVVSGPATETYVVAFHDGRPIILRSHGTRDKVDLFREMVATFRFLD